MKHLIEGLRLLSKYNGKKDAVYIFTDILYIEVNPDFVAEEDYNRLIKLGFRVDNERKVFYNTLE